MPRLIPILCACLACAAAEAIQPYQPAHSDPFSEPWRWTVYPELNEQGLRCLVQTADGAMWFGVDDGVWRYDGHAWQLYTPADGLLGAPVYALCAAPDGRLYAGTELGISLFQNGRWQRVFPDEGNLPWPVNTLMLTADDRLWAGTPWGALRASDPPVLYTTSETADALRHLAPGLETRIIPPHMVPPLRWHPHDLDYVGVGIRIIEGNWASLRSRNVPRAIWNIAPDSPAHRAGLRMGDRVSAVDGSQPAWTNDAIVGPPGTEVALTIERTGQPPFNVRLPRVPLPGEFREIPVYTLMEDRDGLLWFGLARGEIIRTPIRASQLDTTRSWHLYGESDGLKWAYAPALIQTRDGAIWTTSQSAQNGLYRFDGTEWIEHRSGTIGTGLLETRDGALWVSGRSLLSLQNGTWKQRGLPVYAPHNYIHIIEAHDGALWIAGLGENAARFEYNTRQWQTFQNLAFLCETPDGVRWFQTPDHRIVRHGSDGWWKLGPEDGLIERAETLLSTGQNRLITVGYHNGVLATATYDGHTWAREQYPECAASGPIRTALYARDGSLWISANESFGVFQRTPDGAWHHHLPPEAPAPASAMAQTSDGHIYVGGWYGLRRFDGASWTVIADRTGLTSYIDALMGDSRGNLWVGTRLYGIFHFDGSVWTHYGMEHGLADINVSRFLEASDGSIVAITRSGISRFDGQTWVEHALPRNLSARLVGSSTPYPSISQAPDGALYLHTVGKQTIRYQPDAQSPKTRITTSIERVSQPGNTAISWTGSDPWKRTPDDELQYAYRLDQGPWSPFTDKTSAVLLSLSSGRHVFEVRARDRDFNVDPAPATLHFVVEAPYLHQPRVLAVLTALLAAIALLTRRVIQRNRQLHASQREMRHLRYLYRLRVVLGEAHTHEAVIQHAGQALLQVLSPTSHIAITSDNHTQTFGNAPPSGAFRYTRPIAWNNRMRGELAATTDAMLSELQERALLDETAGQIAAALEARELEAQLLQSARLVSLGQMAAGVAHELNQPLAAISATAEGVFLRLEAGMDVSQKRLMAMMDDILGMVDRMIESIENLRIFSRDTSQEPGRPFDINDAVRTSLKMMGAQLKNHGIRIHLDLASNLPPILGHPHQLEQVVLNLLGNARDALEEKNAVQTETPWTKQLQIRTKTMDGRIALEIEDNGTGIDEEHMPRLFEPFYTTKSADKGTGIGLSLVYAIVQNHGGEITCNSRKGHQTTFRVVLPAAKAIPNDTYRSKVEYSAH